MLSPHAKTIYVLDRSALAYALMRNGWHKLYTILSVKVFGTDTMVKLGKDA